DFNVPDADETGLSFIENAILKARNACQYSGLPAVADDSGLEVDALNGRPGIYSARFSANPDEGIAASDAANNDKLLSLLKDTPDEKRTARFQCVLAMMRHAEDPTPIICQGTWEGVIARELSGDQGFGYDPLFYVPEQGCTSAALDRTIKNRISHRAKAMAALAELIAKSTDL
ncbi:MAG: RdgB/HAM1 family non-canonical purine NTP pyrophosphatase, partial [bacterium]